MATRTLRELEPVELAAWRGLLRAHAALVKELDAELEGVHGLPLSSYEVLVVLESAPDRQLRMAELAEHVLLSRSGMTRLIDRLEREGLVARHTCSGDGRGCYAALTESGGRMVLQARATHLAGVRERFLHHFSEEELRMLAACWERVVPGAAS
jgi:DNA-binding MarR family transcriptional regulator